MARNLGTIIENKFGNGLITEATGLSFPPGAAVSTSNCVFTQKMSVQRRYGFQFENNYSLITNPSPQAAFAEYYWQSVAGVGSLNFIVIQTGTTLTFFNTGTGQPLSQSQIGTTFNLDTYKATGAPTTAGAQCQFASGYGYLFIAHPYCDPMYVQYNTGTQVLTLTQVQLLQRDFTGQPESTAINNRPATLTNAHYYNLANQGWFSGAPATAINSYISTFFTAASSAYPSNADIWWLYKNASGVYSPNSTITSISQGNTQAPQGHFILQCFNQQPASVFIADAAALGFTVSISGLSTNTASYFRPATIAFFAGRVWYAGVNYGQFTNSIYYSQIIQGPTQIPLCYQANDPTSDDTGDADLLPSDGGVLVEPEIGQIYKLFPIGYSLLIFASNGIWAITGSTGTGFNATDFSVSKLSATAMSSPSSFVDMDGVPFWWGVDGVYTLQGGSAGSGSVQLGSAGVVCISDKTIKSFYDTVPTLSKQYSKGSYNRHLYTIYWLYNSTAPTGITNYFNYDSCLCYNTVTNAFYTWTLPTTGVNISGIVTNIGGLATQYTLTQIVDQYSAGVVDQYGAPVYTFAPFTIVAPALTEFVTQVYSNGTWYYTFSQASGASYIDYNLYDYSSYAIAGYSLPGNAIDKFQSPYITFYLNNSQASQVQIAAYWDFANDPTTTRQALSDQLSTEGGRYDYVDFRRKMRGEGRSLSVGFFSVSGQPFEVVGWTIESSVNSQP